MPLLAIATQAVIDASYKMSHGLAIDGGVSIRRAGDVSVGVTVSSFSGKINAAVSAAIPHPFFFRMPRTIAGTASGVHRDEFVTHLQGIYTLHPRRALTVALSAGPSVFSVRQDVVTDVAFTDSYPFDAPAYTSAASQRVTASKGWDSTLAPTSPCGCRVTPGWEPASGSRGRRCR